MRFLKVCSTVVGLGLLLIVASCSSDTSRDDTEGFLSGLSSMFDGAATSESSVLLQDFNNTEPPVTQLASVGSLVAPTENLRKLRDPFGLDTLYGTWRYYATPGWVQTDPSDPADAILFEWVHLDTTDMSEHDAYVLFDSLSFFSDSLISAMRVSVGLDDSEIAWLKFGVEYVTFEEADSAYLIYEIVGCYQLGVSVATLFDVDDVDTSAVDSIDFVGTIHLWAIDRTNNDYQVDLYLTRYADDSGELVLRDSDGWELNLDVSVVVEEDGEYEKRDVSGEITENGEHAASIEGHFWDPDDISHPSVVTIIFSNDEEDDFTKYTALLEALLSQ